MKNMKNLLLSAAFAFASLQAFGQATESTILSGATGTTSATVFVPTATSAAEIRDITHRLDTGVISGTVDIRTGKSRSSVTSATAASTSVVYFDNDPTLTSIGDYVIVEDNSSTTAPYILLRAKASTSTSITVQETIGVALTTSDAVYPLAPAVRRVAQPNNSPTANARVSIWLPAGLPSALTLDGNTTACTLEISGVRGNSK